MIPAATYCGTYNALGLSCRRGLYLGILSVFLCDGDRSCQSYIQSTVPHPIQRLKRPQWCHIVPRTPGVRLFLFGGVQCLRCPLDTLYFLPVWLHWWQPHLRVDTLFLTFLTSRENGPLHTVNESTFL